jgi:lactose/L-arabinose transport system substrate-binding protein
MKKIGKSLLSLILGVCLLASCNAKPNESVTNSEESSNLVEQDETENRKTENTEANTETETEPTKIVVWSWDKSFNGKAFEEADKIDDAVTIDFVEMGKADVLKKIHTVLSSGNTDGLPDIVTISDLHVQGYLMSYPDAFLELSEYINYDDFAPYKKGYISYEGKNYGVPFDTGVAGLFLSIRLYSRGGLYR